MNTKWIALCLPLALLLNAAVAADRKPTSKEVTAARGECAQHKRKVEKLQSDPKSDPALLARESQDWEHSCARAEALMQAAGMEKPSPPPQPPAPAPQIVIEQKTMRTDQPVIIDEPSTPPTTESPPSPPSPPPPPPPPPPR